MNENTLDLEYYQNGIKELLQKREEASDWATAIVINEENCDEVPVGASKMGGLPDLPPGINYPERERFIDEHDKYFKNFKLPLICQLNLADIAEYDVFDNLPKSGMLYIFWDGGDPGYFKKRYGIHTMRAFYWKGDISTLTRREADNITEVRPEKKVTFSTCKDIYGINEVDWQSMVEDLREELKGDCKDLGIDYEDIEEYQKIQDIFWLEDETSIYGGDKLSGFRAGLVRYGEDYWNGFLQLDEHEGSLWYAYINLHMSTVNGKYYYNQEDIEWQEWNEIGVSVEYDAD
ncbi:MAG: DUF1963 domain-containing protein [Ruminococcus sp.]|nr:DUF1963 domain-containing protein [Ruminococcus sp.]